ncbi:hypothetical protein [Candidatus Amarolinea dominans]|nr:hypothetical protein [Anaerolineae bacterium]
MTTSLTGGVGRLGRWSQIEALFDPYHGGEVVSRDGLVVDARRSRWS